LLEGKRQPLQQLRLVLHGAVSRDLSLAADIGQLAENGVQALVQQARRALLCLSKRGLLRGNLLPRCRVNVRQCLRSALIQDLWLLPTIQSKMSEKGDHSMYIPGNKTTTRKEHGPQVAYNTHLSLLAQLLHLIFQCAQLIFDALSQRQ